MNRTVVRWALLVVVLSCASLASAQQQQTSAVIVPRFIRFGGVLNDASGKPLSGVTGITFSLYSQQQGGSPLWMETQNVHADESGRYTVLLGSSTSNGVPIDLFSSGEAQWLGVRIENQPEQSRVLLVSVPYALKAHEADTLAGRSISDFVLVEKSASRAPTGNATVTAASSPKTQSQATAAASGPTNFAGNSNTQIVGVTQSGSGLGLAATAISSAAVLGTITGATNTAVFGHASNKSPGSNAAGVTGQADTQFGPGVQGNTSSASGFGVQGVATNTTGGTGVQGLSHATSGVTSGVTGQAASTTANAAGVNGFESALMGRVFGVNGNTNSTGPFAAAVNGFEGATTGQVFGVNGSTNSITQGAAGLSGFEGAKTGQVFGVEGSTNSTTNFAAGVSGFEGASTGQVFGVQGSTNSATDNAAGVSGFEGAANGRVFGVNAGTNSTTNGAAAVNGFEGASTGNVFGVNGATNSSGGAGVNGFNGATTGFANGVQGFTNSVDGSGVFGSANAKTGNTSGVSGSSASPNGNGVLGVNHATTGFSPGVTGITTSPNGAGVNGFSTASSGGIGIIGTSPTSGTAVLGINQVCPSSPCTPVAGTAGSFTTGPGGTLLLGTSGSSFNTATTKFSVDAAGNGFYAGNITVKGNVSKVSGQVYVPSSGINAISATSADPNAYTIYGLATSTTGHPWGVEGVSAADGGVGVAGFATSSTGVPTAIYGRAYAPGGTGVYGQHGTQSSQGSGWGGNGWGIGIQGDGGGAGPLSIGVLGTVDDGYGALFANSSASSPALLAENNSGGDAFSAGSTAGACGIDGSGNLSCTGTKHAVVPIRGGERKVALSAIESPKNWFEDFGSAELANGSVIVALDADFIQTVNTNEEYQVFLTPYGDCKGLYVTNRTANSFEVRELGGGTASLKFGYRITALRKGYENVRFEDHTSDMDRMKKVYELLKAKPASSQLRQQEPAPSETAAPK